MTEIPIHLGYGIRQVYYQTLLIGQHPNAPSTFVAEGPRTAILAPVRYPHGNQPTILKGERRHAKDQAVNLTVMRPQITLPCARVLLLRCIIRRLIEAPRQEEIIIISTVLAVPPKNRRVKRHPHLRAVQLTRLMDLPATVDRRQLDHHPNPRWVAVIPFPMVAHNNLWQVSRLMPMGIPCKHPYTPKNQTLLVVKWIFNPRFHPVSFAHPRTINSLVVALTRGDVRLSPPHDMVLRLVRTRAGEVPHHLPDMHLCQPPLHPVMVFSILRRISQILYLPSLQLLLEHPGILPSYRAPALSHPWAQT